MGKVISTNISVKKGTPKKPTSKIELVIDLGVKDDAHSGPGDRQVSLLMKESIDAAIKALADGPGCEAAGVELGPGAFAENITTEGIDLIGLKIGDELLAGEGVRLKITKIGKECHRPCAIYYKTGNCIMPKEGVFAEVLKGGVIKPGDTIEKG